MKYQETINWMFNQLPMYQNIGASAYKKDLHNTLLLAKRLQHPEKKIKTIHIAGTNGKGSTSSMLASILQEAGFKVGLYTSPHLKDYRERIKINGKEIPEEVVVAFIQQHKSFLEDNQLSFFEMTVGLAFDYFAAEKVDFSVIEVGMGGRLDSTNIITPLVSVITNIGLDHTQFLGNTLTLIAGEKAGIIKTGVPVVIGEYTDETKEVFIKTAQEKKAPIYFASESEIQSYPTALLGDYQKKNIKTALQTITILQSDYHVPITKVHCEKGLANVIQNTGLQGRWQQLRENPLIICDTAHNKHGLEIVLQQIQKQQYENLHLVLGFVNDKNLDEILPLFPITAHYYFARPNIPRGLDAVVVKNKASQHHLTGKEFGSVSEAYQEAQRQAQPNDMIYIGGSTFVVAEIL